MKTGRVYLITNTVNGKRYVGWTVKPIESRFHQHARGDRGCGRLLHAAIMEFGESVFTRESLFEGLASDAAKNEPHFIKEYDTLSPNGYNLTLGGNHWYRNGQLAIHSPESKAQISAALMGIKRSAETRAKMSRAQKMLQNRPERNARMSAVHKGKHVSAGTRNKNRLASLAQWANTEKREMLLRARFDKVLRGEKHYLKLHPEKAARGPKNGKYTHPEKTPRGDSHGMSKLTTADVRRIRGEYIPGKVTQYDLAEKYNVSQHSINQILLRKSWVHVT